jgi:hypothetical protein
LQLCTFPNNTCSIYDKISTPAVANYTLLGNLTKSADGKTSLNTSITTGTPKPTSGAGRIVDMELSRALADFMGLCMVIYLGF